MAFWNWFQKTSDRIEAWDWSPDMRVKIDKINSMIPTVIAKALISYLGSMYEVSEDSARQSLEYVRDKINEALS